MRLLSENKDSVVVDGRREWGASKENHWGLDHFPLPKFSTSSEGDRTGIKPKLSTSTWRRSRPMVHAGINPPPQRTLHGKSKAGCMLDIRPTDGSKFISMVLTSFWNPTSAFPHCSLLILWVGVGAAHRSRVSVVAS